MLELCIGEFNLLKRLLYFANVMKRHSDKYFHLSQ